jgi:alpha,alpha-trehalase
MVLETTWHTPGGWPIVHDLLVMGRTGREHRREHYQRPPTNSGATGALLRTATCISGQVEVMVDCAPLFGYGTGIAAHRIRARGRPAVPSALLAAVVSIGSSR